MPVSTRSSKNVDRMNLSKEKFEGEPAKKKIKKNKGNLSVVSSNEYENRQGTDEDESSTISIANSISENSSSSDSNFTLKIHLAQLKTVLSQEYVDTVKRLKLNFIPNCVSDMYFCKTNHSKQCPEPLVVSSYVKSKPNYLITENRALHFLNMVEDLCNRRNFMGNEVFSTIFELILTINPPENHYYTSDYIINECSLVFDKLITTFPPCWQAIHKYYDEFLTSPIDISKIIIGKSESNDKNILNFIVLMLEETINLKNDKLSSEKCDKISIENLNESNFFNFHEWESRHCKVDNFDSHTRDDKLDRLFLTLNLLTKLLELDLSLWMLRYLTKPSKYIFANEKPFIVKVFDINDIVQITVMVKKILNLFVICVSFGYPTSNIEILSRLISLLAVVINLTETESTIYGVIYPKIGSATATFSKEIIKTAENCVGACTENYLRIIENIRIPFIKYLLIDHFLIKFNQHSGPMCPKKIFDNFTKRWWIKCAFAPKEIINENGKTYRSINKQPNCINKYPIVENTEIKNKSSEIYREEYLQLLLEALESYCDVHSTQKFALILMNKNDKKNQSFKNKRKSNKKRSISPNSATLNLEKLEKDIIKLMKQVNYQEFNPIVQNEIPIYDNVFVDSDTMIKFNEDIKYMMRLKKNIPLMKEKFGIEFNNWDAYINQFFQILNQ